MSALGIVLSTALLAETVRMAVPYGCAALGGVFSERSGIINIALEGTLLVSAFAAAAVDHATGSAALGVVAGAASGALVGVLHASLVVRGRIDAIVSGIAIDLAAVGGTRFALRALYGSSSNSPAVGGLPAFEGGGLLLRALLDPFVLATVALAAASAFVLRRTRFGLRLRACGEDPAAAQALGVHVTGTRTAAVAIGSAICGLGGTALAYDIHQFQPGISGGRGFMALAAVIVSGWNPGRAAAACLAFASFDALQVLLQSQTRLPPQALAVLPSVATLVALALVGRRGAGAILPPAGLGKHPD